MSKARISDSYPINVKPVKWEEEYIIEKAKNWLDNNIIKSTMFRDENINDVINLGREAALPFMFELLRENNHDQGMYLWFCSMIIDEFLKDEIEVEGYMPITEWGKNVLALYDNGFIKI